MRAIARTVALVLVSMAAAAQEPPGGVETLCDPMLGMADVELEETAWGVEIRLIARDPESVLPLREWARNAFAGCVEPVEEPAPGEEELESPEAPGSAAPESAEP